MAINRINGFYSNLNLQNYKLNGNNSKKNEPTDKMNPEKQPNQLPNELPNKLPNNDKINPDKQPNEYPNNNYSDNYDFTITDRDSNTFKNLEKLNSLLSSYLAKTSYKSI